MGNQTEKAIGGISMQKGLVYGFIMAMILLSTIFIFSHAYV